MRKKSGKKCKSCSAGIMKEMPQRMEWKQCKPAPSNIQYIVELTKSHFITLSDSGAIHTFNSLTNQWIKSPLLQNLCLAVCIKSICVYHSKQQLYIITIQNNEGKILRFQYNDKYEFSSLSPIILQDQLIFFNSEKISSVFVKDKLHLTRTMFTGNKRPNIKKQHVRSRIKQLSYHYVFDAKTSILKRICQIIGPEPDALFHLRELNILLLAQFRNFKMYSINGELKYWAEFYNKTTSDYINCAWMMTKAEKYMISFKGKYSKEGTDITILEISSIGNDTHKTVKCAHTSVGKDIAWITNDAILNETVIYGYFRTCWDQQRFVPLLPIDIVMAIINMEDRADYVHLISRHNGMHWKKELESISN